VLGIIKLQVYVVCNFADSLGARQTEFDKESREIFSQGEKIIAKRILNLIFAESQEDWDSLSNPVSLG